jgi:hypothetical protein
VVCRFDLVARSSAAAAGDAVRFFAGEPFPAVIAACPIDSEDVGFGSTRGLAAFAFATTPLIGWSGWVRSTAGRGAGFRVRGAAAGCSGSTTAIFELLFFAFTGNAIGVGVGGDTSPLEIHRSWSNIVIELRPRCRTTPFQAEIGKVNCHANTRPFLRS